MAWLPITDSFYSSWCPRVLTWEMEGMADPERWREASDEIFGEEPQSQI
jgi:hypothetical protein